MGGLAALIEFPMHRIKISIKLLLVLLAVVLLGDSALMMGQVTFRELWLAGNVLLEDGSPPPEPPRIELVCSGQIQPQARQ